MKTLKTYILYGLAIFSVSSCSYATPLQGNQIQPMNSGDIKQDLNNMSSDEVELYCRQCIAQGKIFVYSGGVTGGPIVHNQADRDFVRELNTVSVGCTGGAKQALYFNDLMIAYLKDKKRNLGKNGVRP